MSISTMHAILSIASSTNNEAGTIFRLELVASEYVSIRLELLLDLVPFSVLVLPTPEGVYFERLVALESLWRRN